MNGEPPIDTLEKKTRLGCGAVAGLVLGPLVAAATFQIAGKPLWAIAAATAALFACLALRFGDRFWHELVEQLGRWW